MGKEGGEMEEEKGEGVDGADVLVVNFFLPRSTVPVLGVKLFWLGVKLF